MPKLSKFFRVAVEGATATDGRVITADWINDIAATYNRATYGARVNMEHIRGFSPEPPFNAYGDVVAVRAQDDNIEIAGKTEKRRALYVQLEPTDALVQLAQARQKIYTSIEVAPNFANTGKAGLVGLAVTDSPASLGTDVLEFSATQPALKAMFDARKQAPENAFSAAQETSFELEAAESSANSTGFDGFFASLQKYFGQGQVSSAPAAGGAAASAAPAPGSTPQPQPGGGDQSFGRTDALLVALQGDLARNRATDQAAFATLKAEVASLTAKLNGTENLTGKRPPATGAADIEQTDC